MKDERLRALVFLFGCIGSRLALSMLARASLSHHPSGWSQQARDILRHGLVALSLTISCGLLFHFIAGTRSTAFEAGGLVWWNTLRPVHASMYFTFAVLAMLNYDKAWVIILLDTILGLASWAVHRIPQLVK